MQITRAAALTLIAGIGTACSSPSSSAPEPPASVATVALSPSVTLGLDGTWESARIDASAIDAALGTELADWSDALADEMPPSLTLTLGGGEYAVATADGDPIKEGSYSVEEGQLKLVVDPNGLTVLDASIDGDELTLTFVSNSTQQYPPDTAPEEAVQRVLFTSAPFVRA